MLMMDLITQEWPCIDTPTFPAGPTTLTCSQQSNPRFKTHLSNGNGDLPKANKTSTSPPSIYGLHSMYDATKLKREVGPRTKKTTRYLTPHTISKINFGSFTPMSQYPTQANK